MKNHLTAGDGTANAPRVTDVADLNLYRNAQDRVAGRGCQRENADLRADGKQLADKLKAQEAGAAGDADAAARPEGAFRLPHHMLSRRRPCAAGLTRPAGSSRTHDCRAR